MNADPPSRPRSRAVRRRQQRGDAARRRPELSLRVNAVLLGSDPVIRRMLMLSSHLRLDQVHLALQAAFEWAGGHLHEFTTETRRWDDSAGPDSGPFSTGPAPESERKTLLGGVLVNPGDQLLYTYDFGDDWEHLLTLEDVTAPGAGSPPASLVEAERAAPPEDCGGMYGYHELIEALNEPDNPDGAHLVEWFADMYGDPQKFDPAHVDMDGINRHLHALFT